MQASPCSKRYRHTLHLKNLVVRSSQFPLRSRRRRHPPNSHPLKFRQEAPVTYDQISGRHAGVIDELLFTQGYTAEPKRCTQQSGTHVSGRVHTPTRIHNHPNRHNRDAAAQKHIGPGQRTSAPGRSGPACPSCSGSRLAKSPRTAPWPLCIVRTLDEPGGWWRAATRSPCGASSPRCGAEGLLAPVLPGQGLLLGQGLPKHPRYDSPATCARGDH